MNVRGPGTLLLAALLATGVCQGGAARFYTTNTLTEAEPRVGGDYDALLDQVSGDFGVRSEVLEAAGQEPEYRGADTMVVPLYIPKGAVPIKVARIARSDSRDPVLEVVDLTMSPAADSVLIRRIGPVDRRRAASPPNRAAWRPPQTTRITRLSPNRRSDSPRRRVPLPSSSSSSPSSSPSSPSPPPPRSEPLQSEFGKRLPVSEGGPIDAPVPDADTATKRAKKNELSKDSQFPEEMHTTTLPTTTTAAAASTSSPPPPPDPKGGEIKATTRRFSTHLTSTTTTTTTPSASTSSTSTTTPTTTTTKSPPPTTTTTTSTATEKSTTTTTTTTYSTEEKIPSSTSSTTERRSIIFPRPVESVLNGRGKSLAPVTTSTTPSTTTPTTTTTSSTSTTTTPSTTSTTPSTTTTKTVTSGRGFPVPVRNLPAWVMRPKTPPPPPVSSRRIFITTTSSTTTTTTERPRRARDKLRRLSRLRGGVSNEPTTSTTTTTTTERTPTTTPTTTTTTTTTERTPPTTTEPSTTTRRTSTIRKMPSVSEILNSRTEEEGIEADVEKSLSETTLGRPSSTEEYTAKTTTLKTLEAKQQEKDQTTTTLKTVEANQREEDLATTTSRIVEARQRENDQTTSTTQKALEEEIQRTQLRVATEASSVEEVLPSNANRKFVRRPRPPQDDDDPEGLPRPSAPRRRRPLRPRIKLPPPITYHRASTAPPQDTFASTSTTSTTTHPPTTTTTTTTTTTQRPLTTTITVTSTSTPRVVLTTTTTTTTTPVPTTSATTRTPAQVVIDSLTEIMKQATNTSRNKDRVYNITAKLESLNRRLAEQGIHIIHAEVDGEKIKLDNRMIIRPRQPPVTTFRPATSLPASTLPSPRPSSPSSSSTSFSFFTPSTEEDAQGKQIQTSIRSSFSFHTSHSPDTVNEVQTTTGDSTPTTNKPIDVRKPDDKPFLAPSRFPTAVEGEEQARNTTDPRTPESPSVSISGTRSSLDWDGRRGAPSSILATATVPTTVTTRTRSTTVPITTHQAVTTPSLRLRPTHEEGDESHPPDDPRPSTTVHPTSHHRPTFFPPPTDHSHADRTPNPTRIPTIKVVSILKDAEVTGSPATVEDVAEDDPQVLKDSQDLNDTSRASSTAIYVISVIGVIPAAGLAFFIARRFLKKTQKALPESEERGEGFTPITHHHSRKTQSSAHPATMEGDGPSSVEAKNPRFTPWEFPRSKLRLVSILGQGNFGVVWKAEARDLCACEGSQGGPTVLVAVKGVKEGAGQKEKQDLLKELAIMQHLGHHTNVVTLLGCCTQQEPYHVIMEYVMFGKLLTFLRDHRTRQNYYNFSSDTAALTSQDLTRFACQVASGCEYIQSRGIIHRDLASRNVLVDHNKVCKIADFGLARSVKDLGSDIYEQKSRGALPIRWMAPESLYMSIFTHKSDVWSLGILCWEIVTLGSTPYPGMTAREVMRQVREGYRLERPEHCHQELYHIVTRCWHQDLNQRPSFTEIKEDLQELLENSPTGYIDLENFPESSYYSMHENNEEKL